MSMIVQEVKRLCELDTNTLNNFLVESKKICVDNYNILMNKTEFLTKL